MKPGNKKVIKVEQSDGEIGAEFPSQTLQTAPGKSNQNAQETTNFLTTSAAPVPIQIGSQQAFFIPLDAAGTLSGQQIVLGNSGNRTGNNENPLQFTPPTFGTPNGPMTIAMQLPMKDAQGNEFFQTVNVPVQLMANNAGPIGNNQQMIVLNSPPPQLQPETNDNQEETPPKKGKRGNKNSKNNNKTTPETHQSNTNQSLPSSPQYVTLTNVGAQNVTYANPNMHTLTMLPNGQCVLLNNGNNSSTQSSPTFIPMQNVLPTSNNNNNNSNQSMTVISSGTQYQFVPISISNAAASKNATQPSTVTQQTNNAKVNKPAQTRTKRTKLTSEPITITGNQIQQDPNNPNRLLLIQSSKPGEANQQNGPVETRMININLQQFLSSNNQNNQPILLTPTRLPDGTFELTPATGVKVLPSNNPDIIKIEKTRKGRNKTTTAQQTNLYTQRSSILPVPTTAVNVKLSTLPMTDGKRVPCDCRHCTENAQMAPGAQRHTNHECHLCQKTYGKTSHLRAHLRNHAGEKPFVCDYEHCQKSFTRTDELQRHLRTHLGERNYACVVCAKRFLRRDHVRKHMRCHPEYSGDILPPPNKRVSLKNRQPLQTTSVSYTITNSTPYKGEYMSAVEHEDSD